MNKLILDKTNYYIFKHNENTLYICKTNLKFTSNKEEIQKYIPIIKDFIINYCLYYNCEYNSYHNHIIPFNRYESSEIEEYINNYLKNNYSVEP